jgi:hypothetical protein
MLQGRLHEQQARKCPEGIGMDPLHLLIAADSLLILTTLVYGVKFLKKGNYLLGFEWLVITLSGSNFMIFLFTEKIFAYNISMFCDAFSRSVGIPVITIAGLMAVTQRYKPSILADVALFAGGIAVGLIFMSAEFVQPLKPYFYVVAWGVFSVYLAYFAKRLMDVGEKLQAINVIAVLVTNQVIACIYDFYHIPGDDEQHTIFFIFAATAWSYLCVGLYYAYGALERAEQK